MILHRDTAISPRDQCRPHVVSSLPRRKNVRGRITQDRPAYQLQYARP